jgi:hypothetical protein
MDPAKHQVGRPFVGAEEPGRKKGDGVMKGTRTDYIVLAILLSVTGLWLVACSGSGSASENGPSSTAAALSAAATVSTAAVDSATTESTAGSPTTATSPASTATGATTAVTAVAAPFTLADLKGFVLPEAEGNGLVEGLLYRPTYSGSAQLTDVRHWTLVPPERLQAVGFAGGYANLFFTGEFYDSRGLSGRSLVTAALLFETPEGAADAMQVFADNRDQTWQDLQLLDVATGSSGIAMEGRQGTDNTDDLYPTIAFVQQIGNLCLMVGSQGGAESDDPLPEDVMRSTAQKLLARAQARLAEIQG